MKLKLQLVLVVLLSMLVVVLPVNAGFRFCSSDPVYNVGGQRVEVLVELAPYEIKDAITQRNPVYVALTAPQGTQPKVMEIKGEFPEVAVAYEHEGRQVLIGVAVPDVKEFQALRVSVYRNGNLVRQKEVRARFVTLAFPW